MNKQVIAELAGADSLAAIILYLKDNPDAEIIPTWVITPYEKLYNFDLVKKNYESFLSMLKNQGYFIKDLIIIPIDIDLWNNLLSIPFISPCIACHLYCHLLRVQYGKNILTGERNFHNGEIKINQNTIVLKYFDEILNKYNINFIKPLINISDTEIINNMLINLPFNILDKQNFIQCSIHKEKIQLNDLEQQNINNYLTNYLQSIVDNYLRNQL